MSVPLRSLVLLLILVVVLMASGACQDGRRAGTGDEGVGPSQSAKDKETTVNRIAYIGSDGNVFTINPDGTDSTRLTITDLRVGPTGSILAQLVENEVFYAWPTWSPDSTKLAASRISVEGERAFFFLEVLDASSGQVTRVYDNEPDTIAIAQRAPHYIYWSPDSKHLAFLAATQREQALFVSTLEDGKGPMRLLGGGLTYLNWAHDSSALLVHRGEELIWATPGGGESQPPETLGTVGRAFRAPALSPDAGRMIYAASDESGTALYVADTRAELARARAILDVGSGSAFLWSPTRDEIAVADTTGTEETGYGRLTIVDSDGSSHRPLVSEPLLAFFWSPNGEKIAYVALDPERRSFTWKYVDRLKGRPVKLVDFVPSPETLTLISFFDQYAYSNSVWSPDSSQIVFSGSVGPSSLRTNGASPDGNKVYVLDIKEGSAPVEIATSRFAVWSWK